MAIILKKATKKAAKLRLYIHGPSGSGKTFTALGLAKHFGPSTVVIDTEGNSASKYLKTKGNPNGFEFDVPTNPDGSSIFKNSFHPQKLIDVLNELAPMGVDTIVIDSLSHFWVQGLGGFLDLVTEEAKRLRAKGGKEDTFAAWRAIDPLYKKLLVTIQNHPAHIIATVRSKTDYDRVKGEDGKNKLQKVGLKPEFREQFEYEVDAEFSMNDEHVLVPQKHRLGALLDGKIFERPGKELAEVLLNWAADGDTPTVPAMKAASPSEPKEVDSLRELITTAASKDLVQAAGDMAKIALAEGKITKEEYNSLGPDFKASIKRFA